MPSFLCPSGPVHAANAFKRLGWLAHAALATNLALAVPMAGVQP